MYLSTDFIEWFQGRECILQTKFFILLEVKLVEVYLQSKGKRFYRVPFVTSQVSYEQLPDSLPAQLVWLGLKSWQAWFFSNFLVVSLTVMIFFEFMS